MTHFRLQEVAVEKWFSKDPPIVAFDDRLQYYIRTSDEVFALNLVKDHNCIQLQMEPLARAIQQHAKEWIKCYSNVLHDSAHTSLVNLKKQLDVSLLCIYFICFKLSLIFK